MIKMRSFFDQTFSLNLDLYLHFSSSHTQESHLLDLHSGRHLPSNLPPQTSFVPSLQLLLPLDPLLRCSNPLSVCSRTLPAPLSTPNDFKPVSTTEDRFSRVTTSEKRSTTRLVVPGYLTSIRRRCGVKRWVRN